jgi:hypothetical protein
MFETGQNGRANSIEKKNFEGIKWKTNALHLIENNAVILKSDRQIKYQAIELSAVVLTVLFKFILMDWLGMRAFYIAGTCLFWLGYAVFRYRLDHDILRYWGFKKDHFTQSIYSLLPFSGAVLAITLLYAGITGIPILNIHIIPVLLLYPVWGIIQQFMLVCIIAQNIQNTSIFSSRKNSVILIVSLLFSLVHYPFPVLMGFTFLMEIAFLFIFFRWRNLWAIGLIHGWIATLLLFYVLNRDLWAELFQWFQM